MDNTFGIVEHVGKLTVTEGDLLVQFGPHHKETKEFFLPVLEELKDKETEEFEMTEKSFLLAHKKSTEEVVLSCHLVEGSSISVYPGDVIETGYTNKPMLKFMFRQDQRRVYIATEVFSEDIVKGHSAIITNTETGEVLNFKATFIRKMGCCSSSRGSLGEHMQIHLSPIDNLDKVRKVSEMISALNGDSEYLTDCSSFTVGLQLKKDVNWSLTPNSRPETIESRPSSPYTLVRTFNDCLFVGDETYLFSKEEHISGHYNRTLGTNGMAVLPKHSNVYLFDRLGVALEYENCFICICRMYWFEVWYITKNDYTVDCLEKLGQLLEMSNRDEEMMMKTAKAVQRVYLENDILLNGDEKRENLHPRVAERMVWSLATIGLQSDPYLKMVPTVWTYLF